MDQINFLADLGFAGVTDNGLKLRSPATQARMGQALARHAMLMGTFTHSPPGTKAFPWTSREVDVGPQMMETIAAAHRVGGGTINVMLSDGGGPREMQIEAAKRNLARAAELVARERLTIGLEPVSSRRVPSALVQNSDEAGAIIDAVGHPSLGLVLDSCHVSLAGADMAEHLTRYAPILIGVQIADMPGRVEPGAGQLDMKGMADALVAIGWNGLVEAEFFSSRGGRDGEAAALRALRRFGCPDKVSGEE